MENMIANVQSTVIPEDQPNNFNDWADDVLKGCIKKKEKLIAMEQERLQEEKVVD